MTALGFVSDDCKPEELLKITQKIEGEFGRDRSKEIRFGPRSLDIDIELFGNEKIESPELLIPHPRIKERTFVLLPALEILDQSSDKSIRDEFISSPALKNTADIEKLGSLDDLLGNQAVWNGKKSKK